jgi:hypothetical protein
VLTPAPVAVLFSGGIDCTILAFLAGECCRGGRQPGVVRCSCRGRIVCVCVNSVCNVILCVCG